jgi:ubiquinone/menaquinone biosynthesis C-methylase UbiE
MCDTGPFCATSGIICSWCSPDPVKRQSVTDNKIDSRPAAPGIELRCPVCYAISGSGVTLSDGGKCRSCEFQFEQHGGILCALPPSRQKAYERFLEEYSRIRHAEGRGSDEAAYYLALPYRDLTGKNSGQWMIRGRTYRYFEKRLLPEFEKRVELDILDLGAGTGWLSYRLALRKHRPVAVDILVDELDGLGAAHHYETALRRRFPLVMAEFDNLPFSDSQFDLAVFNSSLHYSTDYHKTLTEAKRCLKPSGCLIVLDSPIYKKHEHGEKMREERHRYFEAQFGFRSDSIPSLEFLDDAMLKRLAASLGLKWKMYRPWYGWKWHLRPWKARLKHARPPSRFHILVGNR